MFWDNGSATAGMRHGAPAPLERERKDEDGTEQGSPVKPSLQPGAAAERRIVVDPERTITFMGEDGRVYATPALVSDIEYTCRDLILEHLDTDEDSVGTAVAVTHVAPTLPGMTVTIRVRVEAVEGRQVRLRAEVADDLEPIGTGTHTRVVVTRSKTFERLLAKAARLRDRGGPPDT